MSQRHRRFMRLLSQLAFLLLAGDCSSGRWAPRRIELPYAQEPSDVVYTLDPSAVVWVWNGGTVEKWHAVVIAPDSVSGIPYRISLECDSCRRSMPRAQVDSMKLGPNTRSPKALEFAGALGAVILLEMLICAAIGAKSGC
jgi:hypothetical protein